MAIVAGFIGELLITAGMLVLLFVVYLLWGTGLQTAAAQDELRQELVRADNGGNGSGDGASDGDESTPANDVAPGEAYGIIRIPRFGDDWEWVIVEGVEDEDLEKGPGHYPDSADAGEVGNFGVAAHRAGHGNPFAPFPELYEGDLVEVMTPEGTFTYRLDDAPNGDPDGNKIEISDTWVVDPVPGEPADTEPTEARITLTTCWPRLGSSHRMYAHGTLIDVEEP